MANDGSNESAAENGEASGRASTTARRQRGAGFPRLSLAQAVDAIKSISAFGFRHNEEAVAGYLGHKTANSGPFRSKVAALRDFDLLSNDGYDVTSLGQELSHPDPRQPGGEQDALKRAFRNAEIFTKLYDSLQPGHPFSTDGVGNAAVRQFGVSPGSKSDFVDSFEGSVLAAGLMERTDDGQLRVVTSRLDEVEAEEGVDAEDEMPPVGQRRKVRRSGAVPVVHHTWQVTDGEIVFEVMLDGKMPATAYGQIQKIIEQGDALAEIIGLADADES